MVLVVLPASVSSGCQAITRLPVGASLRRRDSRTMEAIPGRRVHPAEAQEMDSRRLRSTVSRSIPRDRVSGYSSDVVRHARASDRMAGEFGPKRGS